MSKSPRQRITAQIHIARKDLGLDDDTYRALLTGATGKSSCADMDLQQLYKALARMKAAGWKPRSRQAQRRKVSPASRHKDYGKKTEADKIRALWISMHKAGYLTDGSEQALGRWCHRMTGKYSPDWLNGYEAAKVIEALKQWQKRKEEADV